MLAKLSKWLDMVDRVSKRTMMISRINRNVPASSAFHILKDV